MSNENQTSIVTVEVTEEEYQADLARGLADDEVLQPGRHTFQRGAFLKRHGLKAEQEAMPLKVPISIDLDQEVFDFIKERASSLGDVSYESQINEILRTVMEQEANAHPIPLSPQAEELVDDANFIEAVAKRVAVHMTEPS